MSRISFRADCLDEGSENILLGDGIAMKMSTAKMGILRTPMGNVTNTFDKKNPSDTPQRKSIVRDKQDLSVINKQLKTSNAIQQDEIKSLQLQLLKEKNKVSNLEQVITDLERKCEGLEKSLQAPDLYYQAFKTAQQQVMDLQGDKQEFLGLMDDMELQAEKQCCLKNSLMQATRKLSTLSKDNNVLVTKLKTDIAELEDQYTRCKEELCAVHHVYKTTDGEKKLLENLITQSNNNTVEFNELYNSLLLELKKDQERGSQLESEKASVTRALNVMMKEKRNAEEDLAKYKDLTDKLQTKNEDTQSKMGLYIQSLQNTLDNWEVDREVAEEEIDKLGQDIQSQQKAMKAMSAELFELRDKCEEAGILKAEIAELESTNQFLEAEKEFLTSAITNYRMKLEAEVELTRSNQSLITALKGSNDELQCSYDQLQMDFCSVQEELMYANEKASTLAAVIDQVYGGVKKTLTSLQQLFGVKSLVAAGRIPQTPLHGSSFVSEVLSTVKKSATRLRQDNVEFGSASKKSHQKRSQVTSLSQSISVSVSGQEAKIIATRRCLSYGQPGCSDDCGSDVSVFSAPTSEGNGAGTRGNGDYSQCQDKSDAEKHTASPGFAVIRHIPSTADRTVASAKQTDETAPHEVKDLDNDLIERCEYQMNSIEDMLSLITRTGTIVQKASTLSMADLRGQIDFLHEKLRIKNDKIEDLERNLQLKTDEMDEGREEMEALSKRVSTMTQAILNHEDLGYDVKRLEEEKEDWKLREKNLTGEVSMLTQQLDELIGAADVNHGQAKDGACLKEIVALKKKNYRLEFQIYEENERRNQLTSKAMKRMRITTDNWQKAEAEAKDLDDIIQTIRKTCCEAQSVHKNQIVMQIVRLIDGTTSNSSRNNASNPTL